MFHFPSFPPHALCVQAWVTGDESSRVSPFGNPRITVRLPTPRGLSQAPTSFIGSWCQGIHRMPLKTWLQISKMLASTVQFSSYGRSRSPSRRLATAGGWFVRGTGPVRSGSCPLPQDPTARRGSLRRSAPVSGWTLRSGRTRERRDSDCQLVNVPPLSTTSNAYGSSVGLDAGEPAPDAP
jgi:hypothetical protein